MANINKQYFLLAGSCAAVRSVFSRSSVGKMGEGKEKIKRKPILRKVLFREKAPEYHSGAINKEKHLRKQMLRTKSAVWYWQTKHA